VTSFERKAAVVFGTAMAAAALVGGVTAANANNSNSHKPDYCNASDGTSWDSNDWNNSPSCIPVRAPSDFGG
jgi:hypothetical protein